MLNYLNFTKDEEKKVITIEVTPTISAICYEGRYSEIFLITFVVPVRSSSRSNIPKLLIKFNICSSPSNPIFMTISTLIFMLMSRYMPSSSPSAAPFFEILMEWVGDQAKRDAGYAHREAKNRDEYVLICI